MAQEWMWHKPELHGGGGGDGKGTEICFKLTPVFDRRGVEFMEPISTDWEKNNQHLCKEQVWII